MATKLVYNIQTQASYEEEYTPQAPSLEEVLNMKSHELESTVYGLLSSTDYIITKLQEYEALNLETSGLLTKYATELTYRQSVRTWNDTQEAAIAAATTIEELNAIDVTSGPQS